MSREESGAFATNDGDIGCAKQQKLEIILRDNDPVKKKNETVSTIGSLPAKHRMTASPSLASKTS